MKYAILIMGNTIEENIVTAQTEILLVAAENRVTNERNIGQ